ncbi:MAG: TlpA family protein disulfide reductase [Actinomycetes bacterium]
MRALRIVVAALLALVALLGLGGCTSRSVGSQAQGYIDGPGTVTKLAAGDRGQPLDLTGTTLTGAKVRLSDLRGSVVVVNVWASWCPPCRAEADELERVAAASTSKGVRFLGIDTQDDQAAAAAFVESRGVSYPSVYDPDGRALLALRSSLPPTAIPSTLILDRQGRVAVRILGGTTASRLQPLVDGVAAEGRS